MLVITFTSSITLLAGEDITKIKHDCSSKRNNSENSAFCSQCR